jgi:flagellar motor switch protein FliN
MSFSPNSSSSSDAPAADGLTPLHDVICNVDVVLGTALMSVRDCLNMKRHTLIRLNQSAGGDMQVVVNGIAVASGEVVIIDNSTALRVTDILAPPSSEAGA